MKWFLNSTTRTKLFLGFGLMVLFLMFVFMVAYSSISKVRESQTGLFNEDFAAATKLIEIRSDQNRIRADMLEMISTRDPGKRQLLEADIKERTEEINDEIKSLSQLFNDQSGKLNDIKQIVSILTEYRKTEAEQISLIHDGKYDEAEKTGVSVQEDRYNRIRAIALDLGNYVIARARERISEAERDADALRYTFIFIGALVLILSTGITLLLNGIIAKPLGAMTIAAERIATGDLSVTVHPLERRDEMGSLSNAFATMTRYLQNMAGVYERIASGDLTVAVIPKSEKDVMGMALAEMVSGLRQISKQIVDGVQVLASSSSEILASTTQVASSAAETATAVNETTATVGEIRQTAELSSQKADDVLESASKASQVFQTGQRSVGETISRMNLLRDQVGSIAGSIVKLSDQSQAVSEIIMTITDLAEQSNLLAVNAAVEAARAGEQGKGFTVLAQEIRSLSEQSKLATARVRRILGDVQKGVGSAVMASEQGSKAVEAGVKQAAEAGQSLRLMAGSIEESAQIATQIAASSQQQLVGMDQIVMAMENVKLASEQTAVSTKQAETSAHDLHQLGQNLMKLVEHYKV